MTPSNGLRAWVLLALVIAVTIVVAAPRPSAVTPSVSLHGQETDQPRTGAPLFNGLAVASGEVDRIGPVSSGGAPTPRPSGGIGEPASYCRPGYCETPPPVASDGIQGEATWWYSFGPGLYAAIRPDIGSRGDLAIVCGGARFHCLTLPITTTCQCLGRGSRRLIDLSRDAFASFADPSVGVVKVTVQIVRG